MTSSPSVVLDFEAAVALIQAHARTLTPPVEFEELELLATQGRILAQPVAADRDQPPFDRSTRDGYAVRAGAFSSGTRLAVVGMLRAGELWAGEPLAERQAIQIMTGAPIPAGADSVAMVEHVVPGEAIVHAAEGRRVAVGENIVPRGSEARAGAAVLPAGVRIGAAEIALAAACGRPRLRVFRRPRVAIVATGDELVEVDRAPGPQQIRNSNSYTLAALVAAAGGEPVRLPITPDRRQAVAASLDSARQCDLIVFSGGVSMGEYDLVEEVLLAAGAAFHFTGVRMQPGKPVVFGQIESQIGKQYLFGLPGNPISTQVTFHCFVEPLLRAMCGGEVRGPGFALATLADAVPAKPGLTRLLPARMDLTRVRLVGWQGSGDLTANAHANCYVELRPGATYAAGDFVRVLLR
ncbi:molybdopterin molybdochelatase [Granulicella rosea]|uniref:Molybdopterin molybdenumtransferase n=1 Tax=Granulicella rosea TaxID=474952 RepID=A0A239JMK1_9BACT|nr:gephyrin-like molybdotransferase Glp [Granulicella rosea]SNT07256.1 molybdopterin molybdochelatase [Granulicella rosea]